jgi:hypothetical protein
MALLSEMLLMFVKQRLLPACIIVAIITGAFYGCRYVLKQEWDRGYNEAVAEFRTKTLIAEIAARDKLLKQEQEAQNAAAIREQEIKRLSTALAASNQQLRVTTATIRNTLPTVSCDAARRTADTAITVFEECTGKYTEVAENAERHASDVRTLEDRWPK